MFVYMSSVKIAYLGQWFFSPLRSTLGSQSLIPTSHPLFKTVYKIFFLITINCLVTFSLILSMFGFHSSKRCSDYIYICHQMPNEIAYNTCYIDLKAVHDRINRLALLVLRKLSFKLY